MVVEVQVLLGEGAQVRPGLQLAQAGGDVQVGLVEVRRDVPEEIVQRGDADGVQHRPALLVGGRDVASHSVLSRKVCKVCNMCRVWVMRSQGSRFGRPSRSRPGGAARSRRVPLVQGLDVRIVRGGVHQAVELGQVGWGAP